MLQLFSLIIQYAKSHFDVVRYFLACDGDDCRVTDGIILEHSQIGGAAADIHKRNACFFLLIIKHRIRACKRLKNDVGYLVSRAFNTAVEILCG